MYISITVSLPIHPLMILCFHTLAIVNNDVMNMELYISFQISVFVFFRQIPRRGIAGSYGSSIFIFFEEPPDFFFMVAYQFTIPSTVHEGALSPHSLKYLFIFSLFDNSHSKRSEMISHCGLDLHFLDD